MNRKYFAISAALALTVAAIAAAMSGQKMFKPKAGHTLWHINCPPGSHGTPRYTGVGQSLESARNVSRAARSVDTRAITAR